MTALLFPLGALVTGLLSLVLSRLSFGPWRPQSLKDLSPVTLTPLSVLLGFLVGFLALHVRGEWERAQTYVSQEAIAVREATLLSRSLDRTLGAAITADVKAHVARAPAEWRRMSERPKDLGGPPTDLARALDRLIDYPAAGPSAEHVVERGIDALDRAMEARRHRIVLSEHGGVGAPHWIALLVLTGLLQLSIAGVHAHNRGAQIIALSIFTLAAATCFAVLTAYDRPYRSWPPGVGYQPLLQVASDL